MNDNEWMAHAFNLAIQAYNTEEVPIGSIVVDAASNLIGTGHNLVIAHCDPTAHAEIIALRSAANTCQNYRLTGATLYTTLEPCIMCAGAIMNARISRVVFATRDFEAGAAGSILSPFNGVIIDEGFFQKESAALLKKFFELRRK